MVASSDKLLINIDKVYTKGKPSQYVIENISFAYAIASGYSNFEICNTVVVKKKCIMAVEANEGCINTIKRGAELTTGEAIVVYVGDDDISIETLQQMIDSGANVIATKSTNNDEPANDCIEFANKNKITILTFTEV